MTDEWTPIIVGVLAAIPPTIVALRANRKVDALHIIVNNRLTQLLEATSGEQRLLGAEDEREAERQRRDP